MRAFVERAGRRACAWDGLGGVTRDDACAARHVDAVLAIPYLDVEAIRRRRFKVALDCVRGAGDGDAAALLEALGLRGVGDQHGAGRPLSSRSRSRWRRTSASWSGWCARAARTSGSRSIRTSTAWRSSRSAGRAIGEDFTLALAARLVLRHRHGPGRDEPVDQPGRGGRRRCGGRAVRSCAGGRGERRRADARRRARSSAARGTAG